MRQVLGVLLLNLFLLNLFSSTLFYHTHLIGDARIAHSHFYSHNKSHSHSNGEIKTIAMLAFVIATLPSALLLSFFLKFLSEYSVKASFIISEAFCGHNTQLRAPPILCL